MKVLIVKNITREGPGLLEKVLKEHNIGYEIVDLDKGEPFPNPKNHSAIFVLGGPDSANDQTPKMKQELQKIKEAIEAEVPFLGICLGMQTLVKSAGGKVLPHKIKEIGWKDPHSRYFQVEITDEGKSEPLFNNLSSPLKVFQLHGEAVELEPDMKLLATGKYCKNQIVKIGNNAYGIQGHLELTPKMLEKWADEDGDLSKLDKNQLMTDFEEIRPEYEKTGKQILTNFLNIAKLI